MRRIRRSLATVCAPAFALIAAAALAGGTVPLASAAPVAPQAPRQAEQPAASDALVFYSAGVEALFPSPKDAGLVSVLRMLDERVSELPEETGDRNMPAHLFRFALELLMSPMSVRMGMVEGAMEGGMRGGPPFYAMFNFQAENKAKAQELSNTFGKMLADMARMQGKPSPDAPELLIVDADGMPLAWGAQDVGGRPNMVIGLNTVESQPVKPDSFGITLPGGAKPAMGFSFDTAPLMPLLQMFAMQSGAPPEQIEMQMKMMGLSAEHPLNISAVSGHAADRAVGVMKLTDYRAVMREYGLAVDSSISTDVLKLIPADATVVNISHYDMKGIGEMMQQMFQMQSEQMAAEFGHEMEDPFAMVEQHLGIHPQRDLLDHLGNNSGGYMSTSTGGGGILSTVMFLETTNPQALGQTIDKIVQHLNHAARQHAKGYVRVEDRKVGDRPIKVLTFPGLPIPLEVSWGFQGNYLYAAATPAGLQAALTQGAGARTSLLDNPRFKEMGGTSLENAIEVNFVDTPAVLQDGYGIVSLGMSALANMVRSPSAASRDPGMVMPGYAQLADGAKAWVMVSRWDGEDLVMTSQADRSTLVNACGVVGAIGGSTGAIAIAALGAGVMLPALGKARHQAIVTKDMAQLRQIGMAYQTYAADHNDAMPTTREQLTEYLSPDIWSSPYGPAADGGDDYWVDLSGGKMSRFNWPDQRIVAYDRAMYIESDSIATLFADGHVSAVSMAEFHELLTSPGNENVDFNLPH